MPNAVVAFATHADEWLKVWSERGARRPPSVKEEHRMQPTCPECHVIRAPNSRWCHVCGHAYSMEDVDLPPLVVSEDHEVRVSIGSGFRFGLGFMTAAFVATILIAIIWTAVLGLLVGSLMRSFQLPT